MEPPATDAMGHADRKASYITETKTFTEIIGFARQNFPSVQHENRCPKKHKFA
jgi:hypothetical protein